MKTVVVGGGAAGMMAAVAAANSENEVVLLEKNEKPGKKLFITGKGRCNLTNACETSDLFDNIIRNPKFLYSAIYGFDNSAVMELFTEAGLPLKTERGNRVFPVSDHSSDVIKTLRRLLDEAGVKVITNAEVTGITAENSRVTGVRYVLRGEGGRLSGAHVKNDGGAPEMISCDKVILATGGLSYKTTGSTGDGLRFARELGHRVSDCAPSLVPLVCEGSIAARLQGLSLKNVQLTLTENGREIYSGMGELLFTHFGISGPLVLSASAYYKGGEAEAVIDLKPALSFEQLDMRLLRDFEKMNNRNFENSLGELLPKKLIPVMVKLSGIDPHKKVNRVSRDERQALLSLLKGLRLKVTGTRGFDEAIITRGGVSVKDIDPSTMESKLIKGLYFAGEIIDCDALTGGFNLQIAWSTGYLAGTA